MKKLGNSELALAFELVTAGCTMKVIAVGLGVHIDTLRKRMDAARRSR